MANYQGVCLTAPAWRFVNVNVGDQLEILDHQTWETQPPELGHLGQYFAPYLSVPSLAAAISTRSDKTVEAAIRPLMLVRRPALGQITSSWESPQAVGVCHGHALPRSIRPLLPYWFEKRSGSGMIPVYTVGVPVAAVMGWIAGGQADFPLHTILVSGTSQVAEFTAVRATIDAETLRIQVDWTCELSHTETPGHTQAKLSRMVRSLPGKTGSGAWRLDCFSSVPWIVKSLKLLSSEASAHRVTLSGDVRTHNDLDLARGAACHAAFQQSQRLPNAEFIRLNYTDACVRDVGLIGDNGHGSHYWHTLLPAGCPLPVASSELRIRGACPPAFHLYEYTGEGVPPDWSAADDQFLRQLRWYGAGTLTVPKETAPERLVIRIPAGSGPDNIPPPRGEVSSADLSEVGE